MPRPEARVLGVHEISPGMKSSYRRRIEVSDLDSFAGISGDHNPLHVDEGYASQTNYGRRIVHGAFQVGLASALAGMHLPGRNVVVGSMRSRFPAPLFVPSEVSVEGEILNWLPATQSGVLRVRVLELAGGTLTAEIDVGFSMHEQRRAIRTESAETRVADAVSGDGLPIVVLTGAGSAIGTELVDRLTENYRILAMVRTRRPELEKRPRVEVVEADLAGEGWELLLDEALAGRPAYAVVHAAWPGAPSGGLLTVNPETVRHQVEFGTLTTIRLARWLVTRARGAGRVVVIGSTAATLKPVMQMGAYALGKAAMEQVVRLLAPELAGRGITINAVLPSFMPLGMNRTKTESVALRETAKVPAGRLCTPIDIAQSIEYLLSPGSSFMAGQVLALTGGQL